MANRRMFSLSVVGSDQFLDMSAATRELYFQLGMYADDDGFVSPRKVQRLCGASEDDMRVLVAKRFIIPFESGVIVIRHWNENNYLQKDRYKPSLFTYEYAQLKREDNVYILDTECTPSIGKDRIGDIPSVANAPRIEVRTEAEEDTKPKKPAKYPHSKEVFGLWGKYPKNWLLNTTQLRAAENLYEERGMEDIAAAIKWYNKHKNDDFCPQITSPYDLDSKWEKLGAFYDNLKKYA